MNQDPALTFIHPEMARRYTRLLAWAWSNGWEMGISSGSRTIDTQRLWYWLWTHGQWPNLVADPDLVLGLMPYEVFFFEPHYVGPSPIEVVGSLHVVQGDGWSHALDVWWRGPSAKAVHDQAYRYGLRFIEPTEDWHMTWWDVWRGVYPVLEPEEIDMTPQQLGLIRNPDAPDVDVWGSMLLESFDADGTPRYKWYSAADTEVFIHQELKTKRLLEERAARV